MSSRRRKTTRRYRKTSDRHVWVFSDLNHDLTPEQLMRVLARAAIDQARRDRDEARLLAEAEPAPFVDGGSEETTS